MMDCAVHLTQYHWKTFSKMLDILLDQKKKFHKFFPHFSTVHTEFDVGIEKLYDIDPCQEWLDVEKGRLMNPTFPKNYSNNVLCTWIIKAPDDSIVTVEIKSFHVSFT